MAGVGGARDVGSVYSLDCESPLLLIQVLSVCLDNSRITLTQVSMATASSDSGLLKADQSLVQCNLDGHMMMVLFSSGLLVQEAVVSQDQVLNMNVRMFLQQQSGDPPTPQRSRYGPGGSH